MNTCTEIQKKKGLFLYYNEVKLKNDNIAYLLIVILLSDFIFN